MPQVKDRVEGFGGFLESAPCFIAPSFEIGIEEWGPEFRIFSREVMESFKQLEQPESEPWEPEFLEGGFKAAKET